MIKNNTIEATRESVCMGDDCNAPNREYLEYNPHQLLSDWLLETVAKYVPTIKNAVWIVVERRNTKGSKTTVGYLFSDGNGHYSVQTLYDDMPMNLLHIEKIYCHYLYRYISKAEFLSKYLDCSDHIHK